MTLTYGKAYVVKPGTVDQEILVDAVHIETDDDMRELRASDWHDGAMSNLTLPSRLIGHINHEIPRAFGGIKFIAGATIAKDDAGNFFIIDKEALITS